MKYSVPYRLAPTAVPPANARESGFRGVLNDFRRCKNKYVSDHANNGEYCEHKCIKNELYQHTSSNPTPITYISDWNRISCTAKKSGEAHAMKEGCDVCMSWKDRVWDHTRYSNWFERAQWKKYKVWPVKVNVPVIKLQHIQRALNANAGYLQMIRNKLSKSLWMNNGRSWRSEMWLNLDWAYDRNRASDFWDSPVVSEASAEFSDGGVWSM